MRRCILYYITDRIAFSGNESARREQLLQKISEAANAGVDYVQLREKDLPTRELEDLARAVASILRNINPTRSETPLRKTAFLVNSRTDVALSAAADGVHLPSQDISPQEVRRIWRAAGERSTRYETAASSSKSGGSEPLLDRPLIGKSCHTQGEVMQAVEEKASFVVFAPVFEKRDAPEKSPAGLARLAEACQAEIPVLALGGVTLENAQQCLNAGAAGVAGIRLFQQNDVSTIVQKLRAQT